MTFRLNIGKEEVVTTLTVCREGTALAVLASSALDINKVKIKTTDIDTSKDMNKEFFQRAQSGINCRRDVDGAEEVICLLPKKICYGCHGILFKS